MIIPYMVLTDKGVRAFVDGLCLVLFNPGEVAQLLAPRICPANREVGGSNLTVSTDDPLRRALLTLC